MAPAAKLASIAVLVLNIPRYGRRGQGPPRTHAPAPPNSTATRIPTATVAVMPRQVTAHSADYGYFSTTANPAGVDLAAVPLPQPPPGQGPVLAYCRPILRSRTKYGLVARGV